MSPAQATEEAGGVIVATGKGLTTMVVRLEVALQPVAVFITFTEYVPEVVTARHELVAPVIGPVALLH